MSLLRELGKQNDGDRYAVDGMQQLEQRGLSRQADVGSFAAATKTSWAASSDKVSSVAAALFVHCMPRGKRSTARRDHKRQTCRCSQDVFSMASVADRTDAFSVIQIVSRLSMTRNVLCCRRCNPQWRTIGRRPCGAIARAQGVYSRRPHRPCLRTRRSAVVDRNVLERGCRAKVRGRRWSCLYLLLR